MSEEPGTTGGRPGLRQRLVMPVLLAMIAGAGIVASVLHHREAAPLPTQPATASTVPIRTSPPPPPALETDADGLGGVVVAGVWAPVTLARSDPGAQLGPWAVVLRRGDGSLGRHGAVLSYPVEALHDDDASPATTAGTFVWPLGHWHARVRGDLPHASLVAIARATTVVQGRPRVVAPPGLTVVAEGPYRPPLIHEARYGTTELGEAERLGDGLTYTALTSEAGFEDRLFAVGGSPALPVRGAPAILSAVGGGNATLAWQPARGLVAYVGYSGASPGQALEVAALHALAERTRVLPPAQWLATKPQLGDQLNGF